MQATALVILASLAAALFFILALHKSQREKAPVSPGQTHYFAGLSALLAGDREKALQKFLATVRADTEYIDAYIKIGDILRDLGSVDRAVRIHQDLLVRQNLNTDQTIQVHKSLAQDYRSQGDFNQALHIIQRIFALDSNDGWTADLQIAILAEKNDWSGAADAVAKHSRLTRDEKHKRIAHYRTAQGMALARESKEHEARLRFREAIKEDQTWLPPYLELIDSYMRDLRPKAALSILRKIYGFKWPFPELIFSRLKQVLYDLGLYGELEQFYTDLQQTHPDITETYLGLAELQAKKGDTEKALQTCLTALSDEPERMDARLALAMLYLRLNRKEKAFETLSQLETQIMERQRRYACSSCGRQTEHYFYLCPHCKNWDTAKKA